MPVAAIVANPVVSADPGHLGSWLTGHDFDLLRLTRDDVLAPDAADDADVLVLLGSWWSVARPMDRATDPEVASAAIAAEVALAQRWMAQDKPLFGICFGAQLLSVALGGTVSSHGPAYVGWTMPSSPDEAFRKPWMLWHEDWFTVPPGGEQLAVSAHAPVAYRHGRAWATQFHPEVDADILLGIAHGLHARPDVYEPMVAVARQRAAEQRADSMALFDAWWAEVA